MISNGTLYGTVTWGAVFAVDARTGKEKWRWNPHEGHQNFPPGSEGNPNKVRTGPSLCCGPGNRGVAVYDGRVYVGTLDARLVALDAETGKVDWDVPTAEKNSDYSITGAPLIVKGKVIIGNGGGEFAVRGYISAYDAETGKLDWRFYTVPGDPSKPFENKAMEAAAKTWSPDIQWWKLGGGANPWNAISYAPESTCSTSERGSRARGLKISQRDGAGQFVHQLDHRRETGNGQIRLYFQTTPGDEWDFDSIADLVLADIKIDGKIRHVIMQAPKNGYFYVIDRKTGKFISGAALQKITSAKGLDPKTGRPIINPEAHTAPRELSDPALAADMCGRECHTARRLSLSTSRLEWRAASIMSRPRNSSPSWANTTGELFSGMRRAEVRARAQPVPTARRLRRPTSNAAGGKFPRGVGSCDGDGALEVPATGGGGTMTTAGNLVFAESMAGDFEAFSADKGEKLWSVKLVPGFANPVTYMLDGKQYVSILAGRAGKGRLYTFALDGNIPVPPPPTAPTSPAPPAGEAR